MDRKEIEKRIQELEDKQFLLNMKDRFSERDYVIDIQYSREIAKLKKELKELDNGKE